MQHTKQASHWQLIIRNSHVPCPLPRLLRLRRLLVVAASSARPNSTNTWPLLTSDVRNQRKRCDRRQRQHRGRNSSSTCHHLPRILLSAHQLLSSRRQLLQQ
jgi:hypothetical protein